MEWAHRRHPAERSAPRFSRPRQPSQADGTPSRPTPAGPGPAIKQVSRWTTERRRRVPLLRQPAPDCTSSCMIWCIVSRAYCNTKPLKSGREEMRADAAGPARSAASAGGHPGLSPRLPAHRTVSISTSSSLPGLFDDRATPVSGLHTARVSTVEGTFPEGLQVCDECTQGTNTFVGSLRSSSCCLSSLLPPPSSAARPLPALSPASSPPCRRLCLPIAEPEGGSDSGQPPWLQWQHAWRSRPAAAALGRCRRCTSLGPELRRSRSERLLGFGGTTQVRSRAFCLMWPVWQRKPGIQPWRRLHPQGCRRAG